MTIYTVTSSMSLKMSIWADFYNIIRFYMCVIIIKKLLNTEILKLIKE